MRSFDPADPDVALEFLTRLGVDLQDESCPPEINQLGRTITRWRHQIAAGAVLAPIEVRSFDVDVIEMILSRSQMLAVGIGTTFRCIHL
jgi:hypothetical protein